MSRAAQGLRAWLLQRFTALYLAAYLAYMFTYLAWHGPFSHTQWKAWFTHPAMSVATAMFAVFVLLHAWVGVRDVLIDYVHAVGLRLSLMAVTGLVLLACLLWVLRALMLAAAGTGG